jgi:hypothetical protein
MSVNGASVHGAHAWAHWQEGDDVRYSSGGKNRVFVTFRGQETEQLLLRKIRPKKGSRIDMLGCDEALVWKQTPEGVYCATAASAQTPAQYPRKRYLGATD